MKKFLIFSVLLLALLGFLSCVDDLFILKIINDSQDDVNVYFQGPYEELEMYTIKSSNNYCDPYLTDAITKKIYIIKKIELFFLLKN